MRIQNRNLLFIVSLIVVLTAFCARAESIDLPSEPLKLNIEKTVEQALKNNPGLKAEKEKLRIDLGRLEHAKRLFQMNPELSIDADYRQRKFSSPSGKSGTDFELRLLQEIEISGQRKHRTEAAEKYLQAAEWRVKETGRNLRLEVTHLFSDLLTLQEKIKVQKQHLVHHEELFNAGQKRFKQEDISVLEIDTIRFDRDQVHHDLLQLKTEKLIVEKALRSALGLNESTAIVALGPLSTSNSPEKKGTDSLEALENCALKHRPDLKAMQAALGGNAAAFQLALSNKVPNLSFGPLFKSDNEDQIVGASLMVPLPFFHRNQEKVTETRVNLDVQQIALNAKKREIRRAIVTAHRQKQLAKKDFDFYGPDYLDLLKKGMAFPKRAYRAGEISIFEFSVAQGRLAAAQMRYFDAQLKLFKASVNLDAQTYFKRCFLR